MRRLGRTCRRIAIVRAGFGRAACVFVAECLALPGAVGAAGSGSKHALHLHPTRSKGIAEAYEGWAFELITPRACPSICGE